MPWASPLYPARAAALAAAQGATDFGEYFTYFSFFLVVSALLLAVLFFKLGVEQRLRQMGMLRAAGYPMAVVRRLLLGEAIILAVVGAALGVGRRGALREAHRLRAGDVVGRRGRHDAAELHVRPSRSCSAPLAASWPRRCAC